MPHFDIMNLLLSLPGIILGLSFHELAHAFTADRLGDPTPRKDGRLTIDPIVHIDIIGLLLIMIAGFGWAKPVRTDQRNFKNPKKDHIIVSLAGPMTNLALAFLFAGILKLCSLLGTLDPLQDTVLNGIWYICNFAILTNIMLFIFNLLPIYPLDGYQVLSQLVPSGKLDALYRWNYVSRLILIILIMTPAASYALTPVISSIHQGIFALFKLNI